jgi:two-component system, chemotaxis family, protein-glutamate methylesterase/glutaminase
LNPSVPLRVVVADVSNFVGKLIMRYLEEAGIEVVAIRHDGAGTLQAVRELKPDVLTLGLELKDQSGLEVLRDVMHELPTPVVMISGVSGRAAAATLTALEAGAVDFVLKFSPDASIDPEELRLEIISKVIAAAKVRVVRSVVRTFDTQEVPSWTVALSIKKRAGDSLRARLPGGLVVVGASTGGPVALRQLVTGMPEQFPGAMIIVQHIPASFTGVLAAQLDRLSPLDVREAAAGDRLDPGTVWVAPGDAHLLVNANLQMELSDGPPIKGHRPSIDVTMQSAALALGSAAQGVLLSGMGDDGVDGLLALHSRGALTYAQDPDSCVIDGMPRRAIERGVVGSVGLPEKIAELVYARAIALAESDF